MAEQTNLPSIPPPNENNLVAFARAVKEALEVRLGRRGQGLDAMVTFRDLDKVQMVQGDGRGGVLGLKPPSAIGTVGGGYDPTLDTTPPPAPQNVKASGAVRNVILEWDGPPATYRNHAYAEFWRSSTNNLNDAAQIGQSGSTMYVDNVGEGQARYYWVRFVSQANVTGPWHAAADNGAQAATALDVGYALELIEGQIRETHLYSTLGARINLIDGLSAQYTFKVQAGGIVGGIGLAAEAADGSDGVIDLAVRANRFYVAPPEELGDTKTALFTHYTTPTEINGVEIPAGTYMDAAFMRTFVAQAGQIGSLAVDDAAIANLSAAKLTAGDGTIGGILKSADYVSGETGWAIHPDGWAEFANATVRGTIYADTGWFKGQIIGGNATTYTSGTGMWTGDDDDVWKFRLGSDGTYLRWDGSSLTLRGTLTIEDGDGNVLLSSGTGIPWTQINSRPTSLSGLNETDGSKLAGIASGADVTSQNTAAAIAGQGAFATLSKIEASNVTTYIANAAIGTAQIGNAAITSAKIANATILTANIADGNITSAKIGSAAVDTLQIAGNAVTIPVGASGTASCDTASTNFGGAPVAVVVSAFLQSGDRYVYMLGSTTISAFANLYRNGTLIKSFPIASVRGNGEGFYNLRGTGAWIYPDSPGAGSFYYSVVVTHGLGIGTSLDAVECSILALGVKR